MSMLVNKAEKKWRFKLENTSAPEFLVGSEVSSCWPWAGGVRQTSSWCSRWTAGACPRTPPGPGRRAVGVRLGSNAKKTHTWGLIPVKMLLYDSRSGCTKSQITEEMLWMFRRIIKSFYSVGSNDNNNNVIINMLCSTAVWYLYNCYLCVYQCFCK